MQKKSVYLRINALLLICFLGYPMAQDDYSNNMENIELESEVETVLQPSLDSAYAVSKKIAEKPEPGAWWSGNKNIVRTVLFVAAVGSAGVAIWQNSAASDEKDKAGIWYTNATTAIVDQKKSKYEQFVGGYNESVDNVRFHENMRNGFYIGAGLFGAAGIVSLCF